MNTNQNKATNRLFEADSRQFNDKSAGGGFRLRQRPRRGEIKEVFHHYYRKSGHKKRLQPISLVTRLVLSKEIFDQTGLIQAEQRTRLGPSTPIIWVVKYLETYIYHEWSGLPPADKSNTWIRDTTTAQVLDSTALKKYPLNSEVKLRFFYSPCETNI